MVVKKRVGIITMKEADRIFPQANGGTHVVIFRIFIAKDTSSDFAPLTLVVGSHDRLATGGFPHEAAEGELGVGQSTYFLGGVQHFGDKIAVLENLVGGPEVFRPGL